MTATPVAAVVVLAAGTGTRMRSATPKVLHRMCGRTLLGHVLAAVEPLGAASTLVVIGSGAEQVRAALPEGVQAVVQSEQRGTGHAVRTALQASPELPSGGVVLVLPGDSPLLTAATLAALLETHQRLGSAVTVLTAELADPTGYGRVRRAPAAGAGDPAGVDGDVVGIVEERDADAQTRAIREVAVSVYAVQVQALRQGLAVLSTDNAQREEYLTDVVGWAREQGLRVAAHRCADPADALGVNDRVQLAAARRRMRDRLVTAAMLDGATITDPETTWMGVRVRLEPDCTVHQNTQLHGTTVIEAGAQVGPNVTLRDTLVRAGAVVHNAECTGAEIGPGATVGPYTYLRPGTVLGPGVKVGGFVEMKAAVVGEGSKVPHLSYVGDAQIGRRSNVGAGTIFVNYDGRNKHRTEVGDDVRIGSDTMLVAPVRIGDGAYTAAGSAIVEDVPPGALGVGRARQRNIEGWVARQRPAAPGSAR